MWIVIAAVVAGLIFLVAVTMPVVGRLGALHRAIGRLQRRRQEAMKMQAATAELERTVLGLQRRAEVMQERLSIIKAGHDDTGRHAFPRPG